MQQRAQWIYAALLGLCFALACLLLVRLTFSPDVRMRPQTESRPLRFVGEYQRAGEEARHPFAQGLDFSGAQINDVVFYGHFDQEVKPNEQLILRVRNLRVELLVNGETVFRFGDHHPDLIQSEGNVWAAFTSSGILPADDVEIHLCNVYRSALDSCFSDFFDNLHAGSESRVYRSVFAGKGSRLAIGVLAMLAGFLMLLVAIGCRVFKFSLAADYLSLGGFMFMAGLWFALDFDYISLLSPYPAVNQLLHSFSLFLAPVFLMNYAISLMRGKLRGACRGVMLLTLLILLACLILQLTGTVDLAAASLCGMVLVVLATPFFFGCLCWERFHFKKAALCQALPSLSILLLGSVLDAANYFLHFWENSMGCAVSFIVFSLLQFWHLTKVLKGGLFKLQNYRNLERELTQSRIAVVLSQIRPHFLFNALNSISALCVSCPTQAEQAITTLSDFLRGNLGSLEEQKPVPFSEELEQIQNYVQIERTRFGDRLQIIYSIEYQEFSVPALSLQTLVENAVRHGISPVEQGGCVLIHSWCKQGDAMVAIADNGVGFDPNHIPPGSIGIKNARLSLQYLVQGEMTIYSRPSIGTVVTIRIPKESMA